MTIQIRRLTLLVTLIVAVWCDQSYAGKQVSTAPNVNNRQDVIEHLLRAAEACETLPENLHERKRCITRCSRYARVKKKRSISSPKVDKADWKMCKESQDIAFRAHRGKESQGIDFRVHLERKKKLSTNKNRPNSNDKSIKVAPENIPAVEITESLPIPNPGLKGHNEQKVSLRANEAEYLDKEIGRKNISEPDFNNRHDVIEHLRQTANGCVDLPQDGCEKMSYTRRCIERCSNSAKRLENGSRSSPKKNKNIWSRCNAMYTKALTCYEEVKNKEREALKRKKIKSPEIKEEKVAVTSAVEKDINTKISPGKEIEYLDTEIGKKVVSDPLKNNQDLIEHFQSVKEVCENLPRRLGVYGLIIDDYSKKMCVLQCSKYAEKRKKYNKNDFRNSENEWNNCKKFQDAIFTNYFKREDLKRKAVEKKKKIELAINTINPPKKGLTEKEILNSKVTITPNRSSSKQTVVQHYHDIAKACENLPENTSNRTKCVTTCRKYAEEAKRYGYLGVPWKICKDYQGLAFHDYSKSLKKRKKSETTNNKAIRVSSNPDPNNKQDVIEHFEEVAFACEGLPEDQPGREECIALCSRFAEEKKSFDFGPDINLREWMSCKDKQDIAFGISHQDSPVKRNDYAWGYDETDTYWYGGQTLDYKEKKVLLGHYDERNQWYPVKDISKFVSKGRVEVYKNGRYYPAIIEGEDMMYNLFIRYTGDIPPEPAHWNSSAKVVRKRHGLGDGKDNVSVKRVRRASVGDSSTWPDRLATIIEDNESEVGKVILAAEPITEESLSDEFHEFADNYFKSWIKDELDYYKENLPEAPLYEVAWASNYLAGLPDPEKVVFFEKVKELLQVAIR